jgi:hypothetical protein
MKKQLVTYALVITALIRAGAQTAPYAKCGYQHTRNNLLASDPANEAKLKEYKENWKKNVAAYELKIQQSQAKTTATTPVIPVVFHIILNTSQISQLGGNSGIEARVKTQMDEWNAAFNAENSDSTQIYPGFKSVYGNVGIRFQLARRKPDGSSTPGYEIKTTTKTGFAEQGNVGSMMDYCDAKYDVSGGLEAWDTKKYMNIWVISDPTNSVLGITTNEEVINSGVPAAELGIMILYSTLGKRTSSSQFFFPDCDQGHTLVHEAGHFFNIYHIWGDDMGACPGSGGQDDNIADTPPQADMSGGCPTAPEFDNCSASGNGIMFMNYMDYTADACTHMFTKNQASAMQATIQQGQFLYELTQHSELLQWPESINKTEQLADLNITPNPSNGVFQLKYNSEAGPLISLSVIDMVGKKLTNVNTNSSFNETLNINISDLPKGIYTVYCQFETGIITKKIILQ